MVNTAKIGRFDGVLNDVAFNQGDTVQTLLNKSSLDVDAGEEVNNSAGIRVNLSDPAEAGEVYYIVTNYKNG
jgi:hypothetical protein